MTRQRRERKLFIYVLLPILLACNTFTEVSSPPVASSTATSIVATVEPPPMATNEPTPSSTATIETIPPPPTTAATSISEQSFVFDDLNIYQQAMLPEFATDIETVAARNVSRYYLEITLDPNSLTDEEGLRMRGSQQIQYTNTEETALNEIYFHLYPHLSGYQGQIEIDSVILEEGAIDPPSLEMDNTVLKVPLQTPLPPDTTTNIHLTYNLLVPNNPQAGYNIFSYTDGVAALSGFYPAIAVFDDEGWNIDIAPSYGDASFLDVSLYQLKLTVPDEMVVAASGSLISETDHQDGTKTLFFVSGPMRDFYIVMSENYETLTEQVDGIQVTSYYPPEMEMGGKIALQYAVDSLQVFNQHFGLYPYAEFDIAATPTEAGGVEYPGIVVINQSLYNHPGGFFQHATAHEVAHQWWYGMVGNDQVDDPWLDESLTNYSTILYWEDIEGQETAQRVIENLFVFPYQQAQSRGEDRAVVGPVADFSMDSYGLIVYGKGPLFFEALREQVGDKIYDEIMQTYYTEYKYRIAYPEDLLKIIEQVSDQDIDPLFEQWMEN